MAGLNESLADVPDVPALTVASREPRWYALYTSANREKRVAAQLAERRVEHFLPLCVSLRQWKDRHVRLETPLFAGYVFVRLAPGDRLRVLQVPGVASLVGIRGTPTPLPEEEIAALRSALASGARAEPHPYLAAGRRVVLRSGPLAGIEGILVQRKKQNRFVISLHLIQRSVAVEVDGTQLAELGAPPPPRVPAGSSPAANPA